METVKQKIAVQTTVHVAVERVWQLWANPADIMQWNSPAEDWHTTKVENDLKTGGKFLFRMEAKDGSQGFDYCGTYDRVLSHEVIELTTIEGRKTIITFVAENNSTLIIEDFEAVSEISIEMQKDFCQGVINNFKNYAEKTR